MNILAIDTSNQSMGVAILKNKQIIGEVVTNIKQGHSVRLMPAINKLMKSIRMEPEQLDKIIVAKGPGSYTGVRIGVTTAKSLAWALNIPLIGVSSIEVLAYQGRFFNSIICPFFDARRGMIFTSLYKWEKNGLVSLHNESNVLMDNVLDDLLKNEQEVLFLSPHISLYKEQIVKKLDDFAIIPEGPFHLANPGHLALIGLDKESVNPHILTPNYLRLAEAEANWLQSQKANK